ncbi:MAG: AMP-binding protein [Actinomycetota bacterium]|nr:AMP-binding protein [Actinomycetota bacterium]
MDRVLDRIVNQPPAAGHRISFVRLDGSTSYEFTEVFALARRLAARLHELGLRPGDRIGVLAANSLEWVLLDLAALRLQLVVAGFEPGKFTADDALIARYELAILFTDRAVAQAADSRIHSTAEVLGLAEAADPTESAEFVGEISPVRFADDQIVTLKFTSGSSGEPKGLGARAGSVNSSISAVQQMFGHGDGDNLFLFLPLSLLQQRYWIYSALCYGHDVTVSTYEAAFPALRIAQPTVVMGVPGFYETAKKHLEAQARRAGADIPVEQALRESSRKLFGDRIRYLWTGSAPASAAMLRFFTELDLPIYEGYGLNETCIVAKNHPGAHREGSVGQVLAGKQVLLDEAGVISVRSDYPVNSHYSYAGPGDSEKMFVADGLVRTGDLGYLDDDGFLFIRGRADDVIVLDNGKKIIVRPIEERLKASPAIEECVLYCPSQTRLIAVVSPATEPADEQAISAHVAASNAELAADEQIHRVVLATDRFSVANGLLSGQFKPLRKQILEQYRSEIHAG